MGRTRGQKSAHKQRQKSLSEGHTNMVQFDDDIDRFHKGRDMIPLDLNNDSELSEGEMEEPVFDMERSEDEDEDLDEEQLSGLAAKMAKQARILRQKRGLMEDDEDDEEDDNDRGTKAPWGKRKKAYYDADNVDFELQSSDEDAPAEEEAEALRLQRLKADSLRPEDFELSTDEEDGGVDVAAEEHEQTLQDIMEKKEIKGQHESDFGHYSSSSKGSAMVFVEEVKKDLSLLSKQERMEVLLSDAPELIGLLAELREGLHELENKIEPLLDKVKAGSLNITKEGHHFFETKQMLLLCYCQTILFYLLLKSEGQSVRDHPVIARLVEIRLLLEKTQLVDRKIQDQMDTLLSADSFVEVSKTNERGKQVPLKSSESSLLILKDRIISKGAEQETKLSEEETKLSEGLRTDPKNLSVNNTLCKITSRTVKDRKPIVSGDVDTPTKKELGERRIRHEMQGHADLVEMDVMDHPESSELEEDEFYQRAKQLQEARRAQKELKNAKIETSRLLAEEEVGKRHISYEMEKNKGLTPHRKKLTKNPRRKYKLKHAKALVRRKGQVREFKVADGPYRGESTGIRSNISRSIRFHG